MWGGVSLGMPTFYQAMVRIDCWFTHHGTGRAACGCQDRQEAGSED